MCVCNPKIRSPWCRNCEPVPSKMPKCKPPKADNEVLTKREMFAMHAMQALIPVYWDQETLHDYGTDSDLVKCMMETAVEHADALLKELEK